VLWFWGILIALLTALSIAAPFCWDKYKIRKAAKEAEKIAQEEEESRRQTEVKAEKVLRNAAESERQARPPVATPPDLPQAREPVSEPAPAPQARVLIQRVEAAPSPEKVEGADVVE